MSEQDSDKTGMQLDVTEPNERETPQYWRNWIQTAKAAAKNHWDDAKAAWDEFENKQRTALAHDPNGTISPKGYPIYFSRVKLLEPAYYSRTPQTIAKRQFDIEDEIAMDAALYAERIADHLIGACDFDAVMQLSVLDFINADKATTQVVYECETEEQRTPLESSQDEMGNVVYSMGGESYDGEVMEDEGGVFANCPGIGEQRIYLAPVSYNEVLHTPEAKTNAEIKEKAFWFSIPEHEARERFPEKADSISWVMGRSQADKENRYNSSAKNQSNAKYLEGWEIYDKCERKVYWISDQFQGGFLDVKEDPYELREFYPSPDFIIGNKPSKDMFPTPCFIHLAPTIMQLHAQCAKVAGLIESTQRRAIVDASQVELIDALNNPGLTYVAAKNYASIIEKGGLQNLIFFIPVQELVQAITELTALEEKFKADFDEWFGTPDILQGGGDAMETATGRTIQAAAASNRFKFSKKQVAKLARDSIEIMLDMALGLFTYEKLQMICGFNYLDPEKQARFPQAIALLQNDEERLIRIDIETDSLSFLDEQLKAQQLEQVGSMVANGLKNISQMAQQSKEMATVGLQILLMSIDAMPLGNRFADGVKKSFDALIKQQEDAANEPPAPDIEQIKLQMQGQQQQIDAANADRELARKEYETQQKDYMLQIQDRDSQMKNMVEQSNAELSQRIQQFYEYTESLRVQLEQYKVTLDEREKFIEEQRLAQDSQRENFRMQLEQMQGQAVSQPTQPPQIITVQSPPMAPINISVDAKQGGRRIANIIHDEFGNAQVISEDLPVNPLEGVL